MDLCFEKEISQPILRQHRDVYPSRTASRESYRPLITVTDYQADLQATALRVHCAQWAYWSWEETQRSLLTDPRYRLLVAQDQPAAHPYAPWLGSLLYWIGLEHGELLYIYTDPQHRKRGIATTLFSHMESQLRALPACLSLHLEVRASNHSAQSLYRRLQMQETQMRKKYYADGEDAVIFTKEIGSP